MASNLQYRSVHVNKLLVDFYVQIGSGGVVERRSHTILHAVTIAFY